MLISISLALAFGLMLCLSLILAEDIVSRKGSGTASGLMFIFVISAGLTALSLAYLFAHAAK